METPIRQLRAAGRRIGGFFAFELRVDVDVEVDTDDRPDREIQLTIRAFAPKRGTTIRLIPEPLTARRQNNGTVLNDPCRIDRGGCSRPQLGQACRSDIFQVQRLR